MTDRRTTELEAENTRLRAALQLAMDQLSKHPLIDLGIENTRLRAALWNALDELSQHPPYNDMDPWEMLRQFMNQTRVTELAEPEDGTA